MIQYNNIEIGDRITTNNNHDKAVFQVTAKRAGRLVISHEHNKAVLHQEHFSNFKKIINAKFAMIFKSKQNKTIFSML